MEALDMFRTSDNPFQGRKNVLTEKQEERRKPLMGYVKKGSKKQKRRTWASPWASLVRVFLAF